MHQLILHPSDPTYAPESIAAVLRSLQAIGFAGPALDAGRHRIGPRFMEWVSFLGCSPQLRLEPNATGEPFTWLHLPAPLEGTRLIAGRNLKPPRCPHCRRTFVARSRLRSLPADPAQQARCASCGRPAQWLALDWRRSACAARWHIAITEVYESEAIPTPALLEALCQISAGRAWGYCYVWAHGPMGRGGTYAGP